MEHSVVVAARAGDRRALEELVAAHLPLVYSIVGRTLSSDVDDVVQDTMVRVVRGIGGLQQPDSFRSWLVAVTVNQIREHRKRRNVVEGQWEQYGEHPDPNAEFADYALLRLDVARQQQEVERAARRLQPGDRDLLSLWIPESSGHLTRADIARALNLDPHHATVRASRLKGRLEGARMVVRALSARPRCPQLAGLAQDWPGEPSSLWRKRFLRHVGTCRRCRAAGADLVPTERLLLGLALLPLPVGYTARLPADLSDVVPAITARSASARAVARRMGPHHRIVGFVAAKPVTAAVGVTAACVVALAAVVVVPGLSPSTTTAAQTGAPRTTTASAASESTTSSATSAVLPTTAPPPPSTQAAPTTTPPPVTTTTTTAAPPAPTSPAAPTVTERETCCAPAPRRGGSRRHPMACGASRSRRGRMLGGRRPGRRLVVCRDPRFTPWRRGCSRGGRGPGGPRRARRSARRDVRPGPGWGTGRVRRDAA